MTHQVLARKWRPGRFEDLVGQPHVVRALENALQSGRLHHAYLFSGTRGVGKTTVARILARCLNCETGVTATPCGQCRCCVEIAEGRHLDLIEVDAASRTRVDDTREMLEDVAYAPVSGRYKVYLIDEVHMLSEKSFNALLKTLEEPPSSVVFLLATTDPQKLPVTVLSRCLQFNLKPMGAELIARHLQRILAAEEIAAEPGALQRLGEAAEGSMRDALSLADQAIAYGGGSLTEVDVCDMIGLLPRARLSELLDAVWAGEGPRSLGILRELAALAPDWERLLDELAALVHAVAVDQALLAGGGVSEADMPDEPLARWCRESASREAPEEVQLTYEILVHGARDLPFAPDARIGVEMTLLRVLAFRPETGDVPPVGRRQCSSAAEIPKPSRPTVPAAVTPASVAPRTSAGQPARGSREMLQAGGGGARETYGVVLPESSENGRVDEPRIFDWHAFAGSLSAGPVRELALHSELVDLSMDRAVIAVLPAYLSLATERARARLSAGLNEALGRSVKLELRSRSDTGGVDATPAARIAADAADRQAGVDRAMRSDPVVSALVETFGAEVVRVVLQEPGSAAARPDP